MEPNDGLAVATYRFLVEDLIGGPLRPRHRTLGVGPMNWALPDLLKAPVNSYYRKALPEPRRQSPAALGPFARYTSKWLPVGLHYATYRDLSLSWSALPSSGEPTIHPGTADSI